MSKVRRVTVLELDLTLTWGGGRPMVVALIIME